jgi:hypothetical protein
VREATRQLVIGAMEQLQDEQADLLALLAQVLTKGVHASLVVFSSAGLAAAFDRAWADPESIELTLRMPLGGRQPIKGVESKTKYYENVVNKDA